MGVLLRLMPIAARLGIEFDVEGVHKKLWEALHSKGDKYALGMKAASAQVIGAVLRVLGALAEHFPTQTYSLDGGSMYVERGTSSLYGLLLRKLGNDDGAASVLDALSSLLMGPMGTVRRAQLSETEARRLYELVAKWVEVEDATRYGPHLAAIRLFGWHMSSLFAPFAAADFAKTGSRRWGLDEAAYGESSGFNICRDFEGVIASANGGKGLEHGNYAPPGRQ
ncbi:hypothetical protein T492DRAFT_832784 [Pavlovales sp. CCMP2436]|nr:hypothetical protein T492DRAFT_832784 [Pavlovales sp. CCMP2436]